MFAILTLLQQEIDVQTRDGIEFERYLQLEREALEIRMYAIRFQRSLLFRFVGRQASVIVGVFRPKNALVRRLVRV